MRAKWISKCVIGFIAMIALGAYLFMLLWNAVIPDVFHLSIISYWQALGLLVISKMLFKSPNGWMMRNKFNNHWKSKMENMNPEEREKFREQWEQRCSKWKQKDNL